MYGEFDGGIKLTDEHKGEIQFYEKKTSWGVVEIYNEPNNISNDELATIVLSIAIYVNVPLLGHILNTLQNRTILH